MTAAFAITIYTVPAYSLHFSCGDCKKWERKAKQETKNLGENTVEAVRETGRFVERQAKVVEATGKELGKGNVLDAGYRAQKMFINGSSDNSLQALQASSMLRAGGQIVAGAAFGPAGVGAFNGMYVYKVTGDNDLAWKSAAVSGGSAYLTGQIASAPPVGAGDIAVRAAGTGIVTGTATDAMGGSFKEGFAMGAVGSVANSAYQQRTGAQPNGAPSRGDAYSKDATTDVRMLDPSRPHTGIGVEAPKSTNWLNFTTEHSPYLQIASKIPGVNAGSFFHDIWAGDNGIKGPLLQVSIPPAFAFTYVALGTPSNGELLKTSVEGQK